MLAMIFSSLLYTSCANRGVITGGEKDTIPPILQNSVPFNQSLDFKGTNIILTFDERVQAPQLKRKLLITPFTDTPYKLKVNKYYVQLTFEEPFNDSTTYTLNFADAVTDVTENNPAENLSIAFSTWHIIDSLSINGKITNLLSNQSVANAAVSLYQADDTLDVFTGKPYYFAITNEQGQFAINNMKAGKYRIYAFSDENGNYTTESATEAHGFIADTISIEDITDSLRIGLILQDVQELKFVNSRSQGNRFDVRYNKYINNYSFQPIDSSINQNFSHHLTSENLVVRFYGENKDSADSTGYYVTASDSVGNSRLDTVYIKFSERNIRPEFFDPKISPPGRSQVSDDFSFAIRFDKPIIQFNADSLLIKYDTLRSEVVDSIGSWSWNENKTEFYGQVSLERDWLTNELTLINQRIDSLITLDTLSGLTLDTAVYLRSLKRPINPDQIFLYLGKGTFVSVENDSSNTSLNGYRFRDSEKFGKISGNIEIDSTYFIVQLVDKDYNLIQEVENKRQYLFDFIPPGSYNIRVLVDDDGDGSWSFGNIMEGIEPESVHFHPTFIELRENWEINNINVTIDSDVNKL